MKEPRELSETEKRPVPLSIQSHAWAVPGSEMARAADWLVRSLSEDLV